MLAVVPLSQGPEAFQWKGLSLSVATLDRRLLSSLALGIRRLTRYQAALRSELTAGSLGNPGR